MKHIHPDSILQIMPKFDRTDVQVWEKSSSMILKDSTPTNNLLIYMNQVISAMDSFVLPFPSINEYHFIIVISCKFFLFSSRKSFAKTFLKLPVDFSF